MGLYERMSRQQRFFAEVSAWMLALLRAIAIVLIPTLTIGVITMAVFHPDLRDAEFWAPWVMLLGTSTGIIATILRQADKAVDAAKDKESEE